MPRVSACVWQNAHVVSIQRSYGASTCDRKLTWEREAVLDRHSPSRYHLALQGGKRHCSVILVARWRTD
jgi:hypothetical protein